MNLRDQNAPPRRFASPGALAFVLLCFFLPFLGVSCESPMGSVQAQVSGWDMVVGGEPSVSGTGAFAKGEEMDASQMPPETLTEDGEPIETFSPLMLLSVLAIVAGIIVGSIPAKPFVRAVGVASASGLGLLLSLINVSVALADVPSQESEYGVVVSAGTRAGFWITSLLLMAVVGFAVFEMVVSRRPAPAAPGHPGGPVPQPGHTPPPAGPYPYGPHQAGPPMPGHPGPAGPPPGPQRPPMPQSPPHNTGGPAAPAPPPGQPGAAPPNSPRFLPPGPQDHR
ncbi:hypothetical protein [Nocardiopsis composta]|uniref:Uncharacterized protein n=1 Tax=Nocardiopsis composta TaxID=157465 RepID=A0A7W8QRK5_9ACTN|nr:hypothetical protein [Nocardiopsis composta]MBB5434331.1 hypothetical protein [Nocardiopsis composta]